MSDLRRQALLLLCVPLADDSHPALEGSEWQRLRAYADAVGVSESDWTALPDRIGFENDTGLKSERVRALLSRTERLKTTVRRWRSEGVRLMTPLDADYPKLLSERLGDMTPPVLFVAGERRLVSSASLLALIGPEAAPADRLWEAEALMRSLRGADVVPLTGLRSGFEALLLLTTLEEGGVAVGAVAEGLLADLRQPVYRKAIVEGRLALVSFVSPEAASDPRGRALVQALTSAMAPAALVLTAHPSLRRLEGLQLVLKRRWTPVRIAPKTDENVRALLASRGAEALSEEQLREEAFWRTLCRGTADGRPSVPEGYDPDALLWGAEDAVGTFERVEPPVSRPDEMAPALPVAAPETSEVEPLRAESEASGGLTLHPAFDAWLPAGGTDPFYALFLALWRGRAEKGEALTEAELAESLALHPRQAAKWLKTALAAGDAERVALNPKRYAPAESLFAEALPEERNFRALFLSAFDTDALETRETLLEKTGLLSVQIRDWLKELREAGRIRRFTRPVSYRRL